MRRKSEAGQALILTAVALVALMGFAGLGIDMGLMRYEKRLQQTAADAAAIAGANDLLNGGGVSAKTGALSASAANGFTDNAGGSLSTCMAAGAAIGTICVQVRNPPTTGPHSIGVTSGKYVEAYVSAVHPTFFVKILGSSFSKTVITARAVATNASGGPSSGCLYTLNGPSATNQGIKVTGSATLNAPTCGILDNGDFNTGGNPLNANTGSFGVSGGVNANPGGSVTCALPGPCPTTNTPAAADPLVLLAPPCSPCAGGAAINASGNGNFPENPGFYSSIKITGNGANTPTVVFNPGVYVVSGGNFTIIGNATVVGNGVTFYFTNGATIDASAGGNNLDIQLTAPDATGVYPGILFYQDFADTNGPVLGGDSNTKFGGVLYFPNSTVTFSPQTPNTTNTTGIVVTESLSLANGIVLNLQGAAGLPAANPLLDAVLVE
jgi:Putative Flp pilus-assembly TadE/G-like